MTGPVRAVVFDLGGVLIDWDPRHLYRRMFDGDEAAMERFLAEICTPAWNARQDAGRSWRAAVEQLVREHPDQRDRIVAYDERWAETLGGPIEGTVEILRELRSAGVPLAALSNWSAEKFPVARARYDFLGWFDVLVISGEVGVSKPDPRIYRYLLERTRFDPATTLFVDDVPANLVVAAEHGLRTHLFTNPPTLRAELEALGLLDGVSGQRPSPSVTNRTQAATRHPSTKERPRR
jgi:2-haloacid dehalogenase